MKKRNVYFYARLEGWMSLVLNTLLFAIKYWAGVVSGSIALIADAWHTLSDSLSSLIVLVGAKIAEKPPDEDHPFGHGRAESLASIFVGVALISVGMKFIHDGFFRLYETTEAQFGTLAIIATVISIVFKEAIARYSIHQGKKYQLHSLTADGWHHRSDALSSVVILIGIFIGRYVWWIDGVLGMIVGGIILYTGFTILRDTINPLLGEQPSKEIKHELIQLAKEIYPVDMEVHHLHLHRYGQHQELTFHVRLPGELQLIEANRLTSYLIREIKDKLNMTATIYLDASFKEENELVKFAFNDDLHFNMARKIRTDVFVKEQNIDKDLEFDGEEANCTHFLLLHKNKEVATGRYRKTDRGYKLERFAVYKNERGKGYAKKILLAMLHELKGEDKIYLHAQESAVGFYKKNGFVIDGERFFEAGIPHFNMIYKP